MIRKIVEIYGDSIMKGVLLDAITKRYSSKKDLLDPIEERFPLELKNPSRKMIEGYLTRRPTLKAVVVILDIRRDPGDEDLMLLEWLHSYQITTLVALTKLDKLSNNQAASRLAKLRRDLAQLDPQPTGFSSQTGQGRDQLWQRILTAAGLEEGEGAGE